MHELVYKHSSARGSTDSRYPRDTSETLLFADPGQDVADNSANERADGLPA
jgi:hypothetical protein